STISSAPVSSTHRSTSATHRSTLDFTEATVSGPATGATWTAAAVNALTVSPPAYQPATIAPISTPNSAITAPTTAPVSRSRIRCRARSTGVSGAVQTPPSAICRDPLRTLSVEEGDPTDTGSAGAGVVITRSTAAKNSSAVR